VTVPADSAGDVTDRTSRALSADLDQAISDRAAFVRNIPVPDGLTAGQTRLLRKAAAVMKVNTHAPNGTIGRRWSTPDRWPHEHMWLWDSAFHAVGMACLDPSLAQDVLLAMLEQTDEDGFLPHMVKADGSHSSITQPPILAWATLEVLNRSGDVGWAAECLPHLPACLAWVRRNRDRNDNGIPEWHIEGSPLCRSGESGQDNSSAYDAAVLLDAPDFAAYLCNDYRCLGEIAERLGDASLARESRAVADSITEAANAVLWCEEDAIYKHRDFDGGFVRPKAAAGLLPLLAGIPDGARAEALREHLRDPHTFGAPFPVPSEALDSGTFCKDMWRGPTWININVLIWLGLRRCGFADDAARLREKTLGEVQRWYEATGCLWEYYDALGVTPPGDLDRKQRLISGQGISPISDYHWTAAMTVLLLHA
jgi:glycogen debranching enzyme